MNIPPARPVFSDADRAAILQRIDESLRTGALTLGPNTADFESSFLDAHGGTRAIAVSSGTAALEIVFRSIGIEGRDVVVPTNTFYATAGAVVHAGGHPVLADVDPQTMALSVASVEEALTDNTAAVVVVHIGGAVSPATPGIAELCAGRGLALVEDAAHAHGASLDGQAAGTFGVAGTFSFYPTKVVTSAEGGMIITADDRIQEEALIYRDQGKAGFHGGDHVRLGYAWRLSEPNAAIGVSQIRRLGEFVARRGAVATLYDDALSNIPGITPLRLAANARSNYYKYIALLDPAVDRDTLKGAMRAKGVALTGEVYAVPLHRQPIFAAAAVAAYPAADDVCGRHVCLPIHSDMTDDEAATVVRVLATELRAR